MKIKTGDDRCKKGRVADGFGHKVDFYSILVTYDGDEAYVDVNCIQCGRSGCLGTLTALKEGVQW